MKKIAILVCLAMVLSLFVVTASAAETVTSNVDFTTMDVADADATKAAMEAAGLIIPEGSSWQITDHFYHVAMPTGGFAAHSYIQVLEAGEGKTFAGNVNLNYAYMLAAEPENPEWTPGSVTVEISTDGTNYTVAYEDKEGAGKEGTADVVKLGDIVLEGTAGASKVWVKVSVDRHGGAGAGSIGWTKLSGQAMRENEVSSTVDFTTLSEFGNHQLNADPEKGEVPADPVLTKAKLEELGLIVPELVGWNEDPSQDGNNGWVLQNCIQIFLTPKDGWQNAAYIQKLEAGEGKVFENNVTLDINYWLSQREQEWDPGYVAIDVSVDGENWSEVATDDTAKNYPEYDVAGYHSVTGLELPGTAGASVVYVKIVANRHGGQTAAGISASTITGTVKAAPTVTPDPENPKDGDMISVIAALAMVCAAGAVITTKKFRKEN